MKLKIIRGSSKYSEALSIGDEEWTTTHDKIEEEVINSVREKGGMNSMDLILDLCEKYADNETEVAIISFIVGKMYALNYELPDILKLKMIQSKKILGKDKNGDGGSLFDFLDL